MASSAEGIRWNLNDLFTAAYDPQIENTLADCRTRAEAFAERVRPLMQNPQTLGAEDLLRALTDLEIIYEALGRVGSYAGLLYAADTVNPVHQDLEQKVEQRSTEVRNLLLFFELEWLKFDDQTADRLLGNERLKAMPITFAISAAIARIRSPNRKKKWLMKKTIPALMPSAGYFLK